MKDKGCHFIAGFLEPTQELYLNGGNSMIEAILEELEPTQELYLNMLILYFHNSAQTARTGIGVRR